MSLRYFLFALLLLNLSCASQERRETAEQQPEREHRREILRDHATRY